MLEKIETIFICGKELDVYGSIEEPLFKAVDVAGIIDYSNGKTHHMLENVDDYEKMLLNIPHNTGGARKNSTTARGSASNTWFLTEQGLYEVLMQSRKPIAKQFKNGVKQILREIRMGTYQPPFNKPQPMGSIFEYCRTFSDLMEAYEDKCVVDDGYEFGEEN